MNKKEIELNLGEQPLKKILEENELSAGDLLAASRVPMTYKLVARAVKGRRLTGHSKKTVLEALQRASGHIYRLKDIFNY